jgi:Domain of unknown function (DUF4124)
MRSAGVALAAAALLATAAQSEIYKCVGPSGDVRFTSSAAQCPNAPPHKPSDAAVQRVEKERPLATARPGAVPARRRSPAAAADDSSGSEALWRGKRAAAAQHLHDVEAQLAHIQKAVRWCNDGNLLWVEDDRTGIRKDIPCSEIDATKEMLEEEQQRVERYLAEGLEEECRRAGCLPGWLR